LLLLRKYGNARQDDTGKEEERKGLANFGQEFMVNTAVMLFLTKNERVPNQVDTRSLFLTHKRAI
jgi:hypothetical protein